MRIPPPGSDPTAIADYVDVLFREAAQDSRRLDWEREIDRGVNLYMGNHFETAAQADVIRVVLNRVLNCVISIYAIQAGDPPKFTFLPRETGEPPITYLNTNLPEGLVLGQQLLSTAQAGGNPWQVDEPLPHEFVQLVRQQIAQSEILKRQAGMMGQPPPPGLIPADVLIDVTDRTTANTIQVVFDAQWETNDCQYVFAENVLNKNIFGVQSTLYEFCDQTKKHILTNVHGLLVFFDPHRSDLLRQQYVLYDEVLSADEGIATYPHLAAEILEDANTGNVQWPGSRPYNPPSQYMQQFERGMVVLRHAYIRNQPYPMTPEEAIAAGRVTREEVPTGEWELQETGATDELGQPLAPEPVALTRPGYFHAETGEELVPTLTDPETGKEKPNPAWPVRYAIRQIRVIANRAVDDRECEFADIPFPTNVNIPVPYSPYGQGEPTRLEGIQMALNYVLSSIVTHQRYNASPPEFILESIVNQMDAALQKCKARPGQRVIVPDAILDQIGGDIKKVIMTLDVPAVPADFWKLLQFLVDIIDREGNQSDVMQGNAEPGWSGEAIASLQNAASQLIRAKSMHTEFYLRRLARLMVHSIVHRMGPQDWMRYTSKYPWQALQALHTRAKTLDCDVSVQISSGSGMAKQAETNSLIAARQAGIPISEPEILDRLGVDADADLARGAEYARKRQIQFGQPGGAGPAAAANNPAAPGGAAPPANNPA